MKMVEIQALMNVRKHYGKMKNCLLICNFSFSNRVFKRLTEYCRQVKTYGLFRKGLIRYFYHNIGWLIVWCWMPVSTVFQLYHSGQCTYPCFPGVLLTSIPHNILSKPLATFPITIVKTTDSGETGMNFVAIISRAGDRTNDLLFSSQQHYRLSYGIGSQHWQL